MRELKKPNSRENLLRRVRLLITFRGAFEPIWFKTRVGW